jgi:hypothetical protein
MKSPERWSTRTVTGEHVADDQTRAGRLLRQAVLKQPLDASALAEIRGRLPEAHVPRRPLALSVAVGVALFLSGGAVVMSATLLGHWSPFRRASDGEASRARTPLARRPRAVATPVATMAEPTLAPTPAPVSTSKPVRRPQARAVETAAPDVAPPAVDEPVRPSAMAREAALVGAALRKLRDDGDAAGALTFLDAHDAEFAATGPLADEASTTRVEALLRLGRHAQVLALLDARTPRPAGRGRELLASRAELRADAGRCAEALADFDALLTDDGAVDGVAERALYGRAACRARLDEVGAARVDLRAYLVRFPEGRYAARARAALDR